MKKWLTRIPVCLLACLSLFPFLLVIAGALMGKWELKQLLAPLYGHDGYVSWHILPRYPTFQNVVETLLDTPEFYVLFWNSVKVVLMILAGQLLFAVPVTWILARNKAKWSKAAFFLYMFCMLLPFQVTMLPQYLVLNKLSMVNTHWALIIPLMFSTFPVFLMYNAFVEVPDSILEAARLDGASEFQIFLHIAVPVAAKGILAAVVLGFLEYWNLVEQTVVFINDRSLWTLSVYLPEFTEETTGRAFSFALFSILPAFMVFYLGRKTLADGLSLGASED